MFDRHKELMLSVIGRRDTPNEFQLTVLEHLDHHGPLERDQIAALLGFSTWRWQVVEVELKRRGWVHTASVEGAVDCVHLTEVGQTHLPAKPAPPTKTPSRARALFENLSSRF